ncbi:hypothetical protein [Hellea balneolensis]|uniref:hypothetical protein n=1 Tax=Hellea balneolensis TaxID=287478 RepID=UPI00047C6374|nr:hypothetical protein [Hellea balneolensis]
MNTELFVRSVWESSLPGEQKRIDSEIELEEAQWEFAVMQAERIGLPSGEAYIEAVIDMVYWKAWLNGFRP